MSLPLILKRASARPDCPANGTMTIMMCSPMVLSSGAFSRPMRRPPRHPIGNGKGGWLSFAGLR